MATPATTSSHCGREKALSSGSNLRCQSSHNVPVKRPPAAHQRGWLDLGTRQASCRENIKPQRWFVLPNGAPVGIGTTPQGKQRPSSAGRRPAIPTSHSQSGVQLGLGTSASSAGLVLPPRPRLSLQDPYAEEPSRAIDLFLDRLSQLQALEESLAIRSSPKMDKSMSHDQSGSGIRSQDLNERPKRPSSAGPMGRLSAALAGAQKLEVAGCGSAPIDRWRPRSAGAITHKALSGRVRQSVDAADGTVSFGVDVSLLRASRASGLVDSGIEDDAASDCSSSSTASASTPTCSEQQDEVDVGMLPVFSGGLKWSAFAPPPPSPQSSAASLEDAVPQRAAICHSKLLRQLITLSLQRSSDG
mmetsp:Transcript_66947/g.160331  ORF Transcript_66947/g.160331 Transcript_66947/m.160331 type:complete len:359 (-) Transcript_66947:110-1186(-)